MISAIYKSTFSPWQLDLLHRCPDTFLFLVAYFFNIKIDCHKKQRLFLFQQICIFMPTLANLANVKCCAKLPFQPLNRQNFENVVVSGASQIWKEASQHKSKITFNGNLAFKWVFWSFLKTSIFMCGGSYTNWYFWHYLCYQADKTKHNHYIWNKENNN